MNIVVTGASRGIGYELVRLLAADPDHCIVAVSRDIQRLEELRNRCLSDSPRSAIHIMPFDLNETDRILFLKEEITGWMDQVDILINNAGLLIHKPFGSFVEEDFDRMFAVNTKAVVFLVQALLDLLNEGTHIVNIGSMGGFQGSVKFPGMSLYSASKGALAILTECLAEELKPKGIRVNMLALGSVDTEMLQQAFPGYSAPVNATEMARYIASFALTAHAVMNGKIIPLSLTTP